MGKYDLTKIREPLDSDEPETRATESGRPIPKDVQLAAAAHVVKQGRKAAAPQALPVAAPGAGRQIDIEEAIARTPRPMGKSRNPDYEKIGVYIRKDTHTAVDVKLARNRGQDLSDVIERLLVDWSSG